MDPIPLKSSPLQYRQVLLVPLDQQARLAQQAPLDRTVPTGHQDPEVLPDLLDLRVLLLALGHLLPVQDLLG